MFDAHVLKVLISSPGDTAEEVEAVKQALHGWNGDRAESAQVILLPRQWRSDAIPRVGVGSGQGVINEQLVDGADIVIALFDSRLGQATADASSMAASMIVTPNSMMRIIVSATTDGGQAVTFDKVTWVVLAGWCRNLHRHPPRPRLTETTRPRLPGHRSPQVHSQLRRAVLARHSALTAACFRVRARNRGLGLVGG